MAGYDAIVLGTGPAGASAAITLKVRNKNVLVIGQRKVSSKVEKASEIQNYPGLFAVSGKELSGRLRNHMESMDIPVIEDKVTAVYAMGKYYTVQGINEMYESTAVILATGVTAGKAFPGEEEHLGHGVSYCATCDAFAYKGKSAVVIGYSKREEAEANFLAETADKVYYIPMYADEVTDCTRDNVEVRREKPSYIGEEGGKVTGLVTDQGLIAANGVFILRESIPAGQLVSGLAMDGNHVKVDRDMVTSLPGCFACGDITGTPYQYIKAAGEGNVAALSAAKYIDSLK